MPKSGKELLNEYIRNGWNKLRQKGSHVTVGKGNKRVTIPLHKELKKGLEAKLTKILNEEEL